MVRVADGLTHEGGGLDLFGFDDGTRDLPETITNFEADGRVIEPRVSQIAVLV